MEQVQKKIDILNRVKWLSVLFGVLMFTFTQDVFGVWIASALSMAANLAFFMMCEKEGNATLCDHVAEDIRQFIMDFCGLKCLVEIKKFQMGLVTRVYFIRAGSKAPALSKIVVDHIRSRWYRKKIWVTQIVDIACENEMKEAQEMLDEELLSDIDELREKMKSRKRDQ